MSTPKAYRDGVQLEPGRYDIMVSKAGYKTWRKWVTLESGENRPLKVELEREEPVVRREVPRERVQTTRVETPVTSDDRETQREPRRQGRDDSGDERRDTWRDPVTGMEFVWVPGGCYQMGCGSWTSDCDDDEKPVHEVCVDGFWMGKTEVTQGQWRSVMGYNPSRFKKGDNYPVEFVSWKHAKDFIEKLNRRSSGMSYRLPTEAEWEYACRSGGKRLKYPWGSELGRNRANCDGCGSRWDDESTAPVGSFSANDLGLYDMSGNVYEWCEDVYDDDGYGRHSRNNPVVTSGGSDRVLRGGAWNHDAGRVRCAPRSRWSDIRYFYLDVVNIGFRLARTP
jgi:formylglycine-generating enzyme required for sulfatase activity